MVVVLTHRKLLLTNCDKLVMLLGSMWDLVWKQELIHVHTLYIQKNIYTLYRYILWYRRILPCKEKIFGSLCKFYITDIDKCYPGNLVSSVPQSVHFCHSKSCLFICWIKYMNTCIPTCCTASLSGRAKMNCSTFSGLCYSTFEILSFCFT